MRNQRKPACKPPKVPLLPRETLEIVERAQILISGVSGIEGYSPTVIRIRTSRGTVTVSGSALSLCWAGEKRLLLRGKIENIAF